MPQRDIDKSDKGDKSDKSDKSDEGTLAGQGPAVADDPNPPTARTRAIRANIAANTKRLKSSTIALTASVVVVVACALGIVLLLILRR